MRFLASLFLAACGGAPQPPLHLEATPVVLPTNDEVADVAIQEPVSSPCAGRLSVGELQSVIQEGNDDIRGCYEQQLRSDPALVGVVTILLEISPSGEAEPVAGGDFPEPEGAALYECMEAVAREWRFPPPRGGCVEVSAPYHFRATP